ncbi:LPXTG cell wall anchor domain-containing protein, partial [Streptococcus suis]
AKAKAEAERLVKEAAEKARLEAEKKAQEEADAKAKAEEEARLEAERKRAEEEAKNNANNNMNNGGTVPSVPAEPSKPVEPEIPVAPVTPLEPTTPSETPEEELITYKGEPAYHELPAYDIDALMRELDTEKVSDKYEAQSPKVQTNILSKADKTAVREVQNTNTVLQNSAEKPVYSRVERAKTLPSTGQINSSIFQIVGIGLASLGLVVKRKKYK